MAIASHNRLITQAAREVLRPLGLRQKGRSRVWLDDQRWWVGVVEFQPSWSRGSYLNVGAMWLWRETDQHDVYFDLGHRIDEAGFVEYETDEQFAREVRLLAARAAQEIVSLRERLGDVDAAAAQLARDAMSEGGWAMWDAAVALGLAGHVRDAAAMFRRVADDGDDREWWLPVKQTAERLSADVVADPGAFRAEVGAWISRYRNALKLEPLSSPVA